MPSGDWIKLYRRLMDSAVWHDEWLVKLWIWCLLKANHRDGIYKGKPVKRGQFITGRNTASDELGVSPSKWYRGIQRLVDFGNISLMANSEWTMITICNYTTYQNTLEARRTASGQPADSQRTASGQPADTIEEEQEGENGRREEKIHTHAANGKPEITPTEHVASWLLPQPMQGSERCRAQLAKWQQVRRSTHGAFTQEAAWDATAMKWPTWTEDQWYTALVLSTQTASKVLCNGDDDFQKRPRGRAKKDYSIPQLDVP